MMFDFRITTMFKLHRSAKTLNALTPELLINLFNHLRKQIFWSQKTCFGKPVVLDNRSWNAEKYKDCVQTVFLI